MKMPLTHAIKFMHKRIYFLALLILVGCSSTPPTENLSVENLQLESTQPDSTATAVDTPILTTVEGQPLLQIFAATDREAIDDSELNRGSGRVGLSYETLILRYDRQPEESNLFNTKQLWRNLSQDFSTLERQSINAQDFIQQIETAAAGNRSLLLFVHGYNSSYQDAVLRLAQLSLDSQQKSVPILFSWPSQGNVIGYASDRDAATYARDDLVNFLELLTGLPKDYRIGIIAHSMGSWLLVESLRQLRLQGRDDILQRLEVGLAAPDIDIDVFRQQMRVIGKLENPIKVLSSSDDRALAAASKLVRNRPRLEAMTVADRTIQDLVAQTGILFIDISALPPDDGLNHNRFIPLAVVNATNNGYSYLYRTKTPGIYRMNRQGEIFQVTPTSQ